MKTAAIALSLAALQGATAFTAGGAAPLRLAGRRAAPVAMEATVREWDMKAIKSADGSPVQRIEGLTRKTWKFNDIGKDRVQVALGSEGRPVHADVQLWIGPDWTPFSLKTYSEDGKMRPINTLIGTRNKEVMIEVQNKGRYEFPIKAASNYASDNMAKVPEEYMGMSDDQSDVWSALGDLTDFGAAVVDPLVRNHPP